MLESGKGVVGHSTTLPVTKQSVLNPEEDLQRSPLKVSGRPPHDHTTTLVMPSPSPLYQTTPTDTIKNEVFGEPYYIIVSLRI